MAKKKKLSKTDIKKRNLLQQVRRMEEKRYRFKTDIREEIKNLSPQKARFFKPEKLYEKAEYYTTEGDVIPGTERRKQERSEAAKKGAETRKRRRLEQQLAEEFAGTAEETPERKDITESILSHMRSLIDFLESEPNETIITKRGKEVEKPPEVYVYDRSVKQNLHVIFNHEAAKDKVGLALRLYENADLIDQLIGTIEYSGYLEDIRVASNDLIKILRGTAELSKADREVSEQIANSIGEFEDLL